MMNARAIRVLGLAAAVLFLGCEERVVAPADVARVELDPEVLTLRVGGTSRFQASIFDGQGNALRGRDVAWSIEDGSVGAVAEDGTVIGTAIGQTRVIARSGGQQGTATLRVTSNTVASVEVVPAEAAVEFGSTRAFDVVVRATDGTTIPDREATWSTQASSVATVDADGTVTGVGIGATTISANVDGVVGEATVAIVAPTLTGLSVQPSAVALQVGQQRQLTAVGRKDDGTDVPGLPVAWRSLDPDVATVDEAGLVTAVGKGEARIEAGFGRFVGAATVTVSPIPAAGIDVQPDAPAILVNDTLRLTATVRAADGTVLDRTPNWSSTEPSVASVSSTGLVRGLASGFSYVVAELDGARDSALVRVALRPIAAVVVLPSEITLSVGGTGQLTAQVISDDGTQQTREITWSSANPNIATVDGSGVVTARAAGVAVIRATAGGVTGTAVVNVDPPPITSIDVRPSTVELEIGGSASLTAVGIAENGTEVTGLGVSWRSSNTAVATVNSSGTVSAVAAGTAQIIASAQGVEGSATVTVRGPAGATSISIEGGNFSLATGASRQLSAVLREADGDVFSGSISWSTKSAAIATVSSSGLVRAVAPGETYIVATHQQLRDSVRVTVTASPIVSLVVRPSSLSLAAGATGTLSAVGIRQNGEEVTGLSVTWSTGNSAIATVSSSGVVTAQGAGTTQIQAAYQGLTGSASVTVAASSVPATIDISGSNFSLQVGQTRALSATVRNAAGDVIDADVAWSSSNGGVAGVADGTVTAVGAGTAYIVAVAGAARDSVQVTVTAPAGSVATVEVLPSSATIEKDKEIQLRATVRDAAGNELNRTVTWATNQNNIVNVSSSGRVKGKREGTAVVTATVDGVTGSATITVVDDD